MAKKSKSPKRKRAGSKSSAKKAKPVKVYPFRVCTHRGVKCRATDLKPADEALKELKN